MPKKIDPLNKKQYGAVTAMLTVADIKAAASFYQKAFGFSNRGIMKGPDGKPMHAELALRGPASRALNLAASPARPEQESDDRKHSVEQVVDVCGICDRRFRRLGVPNHEVVAD